MRGGYKSDWIIDPALGNRFVYTFCNRHGSSPDTLVTVIASTAERNVGGLLLVQSIKDKEGIEASFHKKNYNKEENEIVIDKARHQLLGDKTLMPMYDSVSELKHLTQTEKTQLMKYKQNCVNTEKIVSSCADCKLFTNFIYPSLFPNISINETEDSFLVRSSSKADNGASLFINKVTGEKIMSYFPIGWRMGYIIDINIDNDSVEQYRADLIHHAIGELNETRLTEAVTLYKKLKDALSNFTTEFLV